MIENQQKKSSGFSILAAEPRDVLVERHNRLSAAIRILNEAYQVRLYTYFKI